MKADYSDPMLQKLLTRRAAMNPYGGVRSQQGKDVESYLGEREKRKLHMAQVGLETKMNQARIAQMGFDQGMAQKQLGLSQGYLGLEQQGMGIREKEFGLKERGFGLQERNQDLKEKSFGLDEKSFGIRSQLADLSNREASWRNDLATTMLAEKEKEMNMATWMGLGTSAYAAYEGSRRNKLQEQEAADLRAERALRKQYYTSQISAPAWTRRTGTSGSNYSMGMGGR